jgi:uncharacterized circularly permuted ATP-grasp superfamily protein/uncharacterized alpha-E superfamily protein
MVEPQPYDPTRVPASLAADYPVASGAFDEMCSAPGVLRSHWTYTLRVLDGLGSDELDARSREIRRRLRENGVTYNAHGGPESGGRPWPLDPIPLLVPSREWGRLEQGLIQRAELLDLILRDLYGPRDLLRRGLLPPELVLGHPGYLRPCVGIPTRSGRHLEFYAADLVRTADGTVRAVSDHSQAPSGAGYALENRIVLSRVLPSLYRDSQVHRLALYFRAVRFRLSALAPGAAEPRVVLLTPGPGDPAYFEHAYLAKYQGYTLAQGTDLTVRGERLWLKTLDGLQRVDVVLRRLDGALCDPLELRGDAFLGPAGLVQACRRGQVALANPLGSGVAENPALLAFLPSLCRELLAEDLRLPSVPTWWCGRPEDRDYVLSHLEDLVIRPTAPGSGQVAVYGRVLDRAARERLQEQIRGAPHAFVAQQPPRLSRAPTLAGARLEPRPVILRSFLVAQEGAYAVLPGGLARVGPDDDLWALSGGREGLSKDVWVLASEPEHSLSLLPPAGRPLPLTREGGEVASRVAENLFWMGRYAARAESTARLLREVLRVVLEAEADLREACLPALLRAVTLQTGTLPGFAGEGAAALLAVPEAELLSVIADGGRAGSVRFDVESLARAAREVRDRLSADTWRLVNDLGEELESPADLGDALEGLERLVLALAAFTGLSAESMSRGQGWRFLDAGWRVERALQTVDLVRNLFAPNPCQPEPLQETLLVVTDSLMTYRRRYRSQVDAGPVLDLVLQDESNPRSVAYQLARLQEQLPRFPDTGLPPHRTLHERALLEALTALRLAELVAEPGGGGPPAGDFFRILARLDELLGALSDSLAASYFSHTETPRQLVDAP